MTQKKSKSGPEELSCFHLDWPAHPEFRYMRWYWKVDGPSIGIAASVLGKLNPAGHQAARHDLLLPGSAPGEYADLRYLLERYDATQPVIERNGYAQFNIILDADRPLHAGWELVRAWTLSYFVRELQLAAVLVLHAPFLAGSANEPHVHILVPARRLTANGFGLHARDTCSDAGAAEALASWLAFNGVEAA
ncbi:hypothetical protein [Sphingobium bisphenolivorans]|uniref:hypothetical protein n=1 Tax=Sphingobium bisphenolivorans TaxID=1335760 RepID=UPI0003B5B14F|nr:hypothetical protein [Sphingobium bisphenolivorans]